MYIVCLVHKRTRRYSIEVTAWCVSIEPNQRSSLNLAGGATILSLDLNLYPNLCPDPGMINHFFELLMN